MERLSSIVAIFSFVLILLGMVYYFLGRRCVHEWTTGSVYRDAEKDMSYMICA